MMTAGLVSECRVDRQRLVLLLATTAIAAAPFGEPAAAQSTAPEIEIALVQPAGAMASDQPGQDADAGEPEQEIVVTGSRIARDGYSAPTPVSVIGEQELQAEAPANISDFVNTLPAVRGSTTAASTNGSLSNGAAGINAVNLRNLGPNRTLVLFDGQRSVASTTTGTVDVNTFPQALISRVEVVTGGASSAYGSDAVSGVVNFILNREFKGFEAEYEFGVTTYGDGENHKLSATGGTEFADGRGHFTISGEMFKQSGIQTIDRKWNDRGFFLINNPAYSGSACTDAATAATPCLPEFLATGGAGTGQFTPGGLISTGPFRGTYFGSINPTTGRATVNQLVFGATNGQWMLGGDLDITTEGHRSSASLQPKEDRYGAFARLSYEFAPFIEVFGQFSYAQYEGSSFYQQTPTTGVTIQVAPSAANNRLVNAFLPPDFAAAVATYNANPALADITTVQIGTSNLFLPPQGSNNKREVFRYVAGADGAFATGAIDWTWDAYYQLGKAKTNEMLTNAWNIQRLANATDAVFAPAGNPNGIPAGTIACRINIDSNAANDDAACVPLNRIGRNGASPESISYILYGGLQPLRRQQLKQQVAAINFSTNNLVDLWAGPIAIAFGAEYRKESVTGSVDPLFRPIVANGVTTGTWIYGNYLPTFGSYTVREAYLEALVPIFAGMDFNGAFRLTDYSTSGRVETWKAGLTWQVIDDVKFRGTVSRDIRAPNLAELFAPGTGRTNTVNVPQPNGTVVTNQFNESTVGNRDLTPEVATTYGVGAILTPTFLPGFAMSIDYYNIELEDAIDSLTAQTLTDQCYRQDIQSACSAISTTGGRGVTTPGLAVTSIEIKPTNFVGVTTSGVDIEASYTRALGPGDITLRALVSHAIDLKTDNGVTATTDAAGQNTGGLPDWTYRFTGGYEMTNGFGFQLVARGISGGVYNNNYVECDTDCPVSTADFRTVNTNRIKGAFFFDMNARYRFSVGGARTEAFIAIRNIFDKDPVPVGNGPTGNNIPAYPQTNRLLYDVLGRVFRLGVRIRI